MSQTIQIQEENQGIIRLTRSDANQLIPSLESAYYGLILQGKYLPKITSSIITGDYLLQVLFGNYYVPESNKIAIGVLLKSVKKYDLLEEIQKIELGNGKQWGITRKRQPDKVWAINVLKTLKPTHHFFEKYDIIQNYDMKNFTTQQLLQMKSLDVTVGKKSIVKRFFRISKEEQEVLKQKKAQQKKNYLEKKIQRKQMVIEEVEKEIEEIDQQLKDVEEPQ